MSELRNKIIQCDYCSQPNSVLDSECCYCGYPLSGTGEVIAREWN